MTEVLPELFGPMNTTGLPRSTSTVPKRLKLRTVSLVSMRYLLNSQRLDIRIVVRAGIIGPLIRSDLPFPVSVQVIRRSVHGSHDAGPRTCRTKPAPGETSLHDAVWLRGVSASRGATGSPA